MSLRVLRIRTQEESGFVLADPVGKGVQSTVCCVKQNDTPHALGHAAILQRKGLRQEAATISHEYHWRSGETAFRSGVAIFPRQLVCGLIKEAPESARLPELAGAGI